MYKFGNTSKERLSTCHNDLQQLFEYVVQRYDCSVLCGHRGKVEQDTAFKEKRSKLKWPKSKHNKKPSIAVDVVPYPIDWGNTGTMKQKKAAISRFYHFAGYVLAVADSMKIKIRWGGDWDSDKFFDDQNFNDLPHWELVDVD